MTVYERIYGAGFEGMLMDAWGDLECMDLEGRIESIHCATSSPSVPRKDPEILFRDIMEYRTAGFHPHPLEWDGWQP